MITEDEFMLYEDVKQCGETNMSNSDMVSFLTYLDKKTIAEIRKNYTKLKKKYLPNEA